MTKRAQPIEFLRNAGFESLLPMQEVFLEVCESHPHCVLYAPTGSGKTLAFLLAALMRNPDNTPSQGLILSPTRELCQQIESVFRALKSGKNVVSCYGGHSVKTEANRLAANPDFIIATPGRFCDHLRNGRIEALENTRTLIVDEFDKCLEFGFEQEMQMIFETVPRVEQRILVSATEIHKIPTYCEMPTPKIVDERNLDIQPEVKEVVVPGSDSPKEDLLALLCQFRNEKAIVFCNYREVAEDVHEFLNAKGFVSFCYHGGMDQEHRERALIKFRNDSAHTLVCTDLGSRGLDIPEVEHIVHYQLPPSLAAYIHRNGRTARQGAKGVAYLLKSEEAQLPFYLDKNYESFYLAKSGKVPVPENSTLYIGAGKRDKVNKVDVLGFLIQQGGLSKEEIGLIFILDHSAYAAVPAKKAATLIQNIRGVKIKGQKVKIALSR